MTFAHELSLLLETPCSQTLLIVGVSKAEPGPKQQFGLGSGILTHVVLSCLRRLNGEAVERQKLKLTARKLDALLALSCNYAAFQSEASRYCRALAHACALRSIFLHQAMDLVSSHLVQPHHCAGDRLLSQHQVRSQRTGSRSHRSSTWTRPLFCLGTSPCALQRSTSGHWQRS